MVRQTLGEDAVIVATREEHGGKGVRVTAAIEQKDSAGEYGQFEREFERDFRELTNVGRRSVNAPASDIPNFEIETVREPQTSSRAVSYTHLTLPTSDLV